MATCSIPECNRPAKARGWCNMHWERWRKHGIPTAIVHEREFCRKLREKYDLKSIRELPERRVWSNMLDRCQNPNNKYYKYYGGRGIKVCERWQFFRAFYEDMGQRPSKKHQLDRIKNDGDYKPNNCRWTTATVNNRNKPNVILSIKKAKEIRSKYQQGESLTLLGKEYGVTKHMIYLIVNNKKWVEER